MSAVPHHFFELATSGAQLAAVAPVSEVYTPEGGHILSDVPSSPHYETWNYSVAYEKDSSGENVPVGGNTAIFRIFPGGLTEPVFVTKPQENAHFTVEVLSGTGKMIRSKEDGEVEEVSIGPGDTVIIQPKQAYSYVNTAHEDLLLKDTAFPAFEDGDDQPAYMSEIPDSLPPQRPGFDMVVAGANTSNQRVAYIPDAFFDLVGRAMVANGE